MFSIKGDKVHMLSEVYTPYQIHILFKLTERLPKELEEFKHWHKPSVKKKLF